MKKALALLTVALGLTAAASVASAASYSPFHHYPHWAQVVFSTHNAG
jgi:uncharacterized protein YcfJ